MLRSARRLDGAAGIDTVPGLGPIPYVTREIDGATAAMPTLEPAKVRRLGRYGRIAFAAALYDSPEALAERIVAV